VKKAPWKPGLVVCVVGLCIVPLGPLFMSLFVVHDTAPYVGIVLRGATISLVGLAVAGAGAVQAILAWSRQ